MDKNYKMTENIVYFCKYHVVWCSKYKRDVLTGDVKTRLKELILSYAVNIPVDIQEMEIFPNYVRMIMEAEPQFGIHKAVKSLKRYSSRMLRNEFPFLKTKVPTLWTNSYFVSTAEDVPCGEIRKYIINQKTSQRQKNKLG